MPDRQSYSLAVVTVTRSQVVGQEYHKGNRGKYNLVHYGASCNLVHYVILISFTNYFFMVGDLIFVFPPEEDVDSDRTRGLSVGCT